MTQAISEDKIYSLDKISITNVKEFPDAPGIYFVFQDDVLIYIGKAERSFRKRWRDHHRLPEFEKITNCTVSFLEINQGDIPEIEKRLILEFRPKVNGSTVPALEECTRSRVTLEGMTLEDLLKAHPKLSKDDLSFIVSCQKSLIDRWFVKTGTKRIPTKHHKLTFEFAHWFLSGGFDSGLPEPTIIQGFKDVAQKMKQGETPRQKKNQPNQIALPIFHDTPHSSPQHG